MKKVRKAVIPAAGLGTRFLPATKAVPKEMIPIVDKPTIQYIVEELAESGIEELLIITSRTKKTLEDHFDKSYELENELLKGKKTEMLDMVSAISKMVNVTYVRQAEAKGLGNAIYCAKSFVGDEPFAVLLGDDVVKNDKPCLLQMIEKYNEYGGSVLGVQTVPDNDVSKYGIVSGDKIGDRMYRVFDMVEKPKKEEAPTNVAVLGRYIITPQIFSHIENTKPGAGGEIQLTDALCSLAKEEPVYAYDFIGRRYDVGSKQGFLEATVEYALSRDDIKGEFLPYLKNIVNNL